MHCHLLAKCKWCSADMVFELLLESLGTPRMLFHLCDGQSSLNVPIEHGFDEVNVVLTHDPWDSQLVIQDLVDAVEWIFFVD